MPAPSLPQTSSTASREPKNNSCPLSRRFDCSRMAGWVVAAQFATLILSLVALFPPTPSSLSFQMAREQPADGDPPAAVERNDRAGSNVRTCPCASAFVYLTPPTLHDIHHHRRWCSWCRCCLLVVIAKDPYSPCTAELSSPTLRLWRC